MSEAAGAFPLHTDLGRGWHQVDSGYYTQGHTSVFIVADSGRAAILDTANNAATPRILEALQAIGLSPTDVDHVVVSHAHLDHCGGAGSLVEELPNAVLVAHHKAAQHVVEPGALIDGAKTVYGDSFDRLYGTVLPVPQERTMPVREGESLSVGSRRLEVLETPGHTFNHVCVLDREADCVYAGDTFGVLLPSQFGLRDTMRVPAAPTQFSPKDWKESIKRIAGLGVSRVMLAHFGHVGEGLDDKARELIDEIEEWIEITREAVDKEDPAGHIADRIKRSWLGKMGEAAANLPCDMLDNDVNLNKMGLSMWMEKHLDSYDG